MRAGLVLILCAVIGLLNAADESSTLKNTQVKRSVDLSSSVVEIKNVITIENTSGANVKSYTYVIEPSHAKNVAFIGAKLADASDDKGVLKVTELSQDSTKGATYKIDLSSDLAPGKQVTIEVVVALPNLLRPYPTEITQQEKQLVVFDGNVYYYSVYATQKQTTVVHLDSERVESYTQVKPTSKSETTITYGPYENVKPLTQEELRVHAENNAAFLTIEQLERLIEVSHWGNIAVEETMDVLHTGAKLVGSFSRFEYMRRQGGASSVKAFKMLLPPGSSGVYYRDEIGNISTSNLRLPPKAKKNDPVELELRPRFPLFGGWKTRYTIGYNLPVYQYLFNKGNQFVLKMKLLDHLMDDQYIENADIRIILPEHSTNIEFVAPYSVERKKNELHYTYLDTTGRPVVVINKKNAVDNHIQDFQIKYTYNKNVLISKPLLLVAAFFIVFLVVIFIVRVDFSITHSGEQVRKEKEN